MALALDFKIGEIAKKASMTLPSLREGSRLADGEGKLQLKVAIALNANSPLRRLDGDSPRGRVTCSSLTRFKVSAIGREPPDP
jgi:hypothetical protein